MKWLVAVLILIAVFIAGCTNFTGQSNSSTNNASYCSNKFPDSYDNRDIQIYVNMDSRHSSYRILINGNGSAYYSGSLGEDEQGWERSGILTQEKIDELISAFKENNFLCMNGTYGNTQGRNYIDYSVNLKIGNITKQVRFGNGATNISLIGAIEGSVSNLNSSLPSDVCRGFGDNDCLANYMNNSDYNFYRSSSLSKCIPLNNTNINTNGTVLFEQCNIYYLGIDFSSVEEELKAPTYCFYGVNSSEGCLLYIRSKVKFASGGIQTYNSYEIGEVINLSGIVSTHDDLLKCDNQLHYNETDCRYFVLGNYSMQ